MLLQEQCEVESQSSAGVFNSKLISLLEITLTALIQLSVALGLSKRPQLYSRSLIVNLYIVHPPHKFQEVSIRCRQQSRGIHLV